MEWVFILGGSSGFGLATACLFAEKGFNIFVVHRDSRADAEVVETSFKKIRKSGVGFVSMNVNANTDDGQHKIIMKLKEILKRNSSLKVFLFSVADGNIKPLISIKKDRELLSREDFAHTIYSMGSSFIFWSRILFENGFFKEGSRIVGLTSEGSSKVIPGYAAVAAAKSVLECGSRYLASDLAAFGITTNLICAGITDTPALRALPDYKKLVKYAQNKSNMNRNTLPEDVAKVVYLLSKEESKWINGEIIRVNGGEHLML